MGLSKAGSVLCLPYETLNRATEQLIAKGRGAQLFQHPQKGLFVSMKYEGGVGKSVLPSRHKSWWFLPSHL